MSLPLAIDPRLMPFNVDYRASIFQPPRWTCHADCLSIWRLWLHRQMSGWNVATVHDRNCRCSSSWSNCTCSSSFDFNGSGNAVQWCWMQSIELRLDRGVLLYAGRPEESFGLDGDMKQWMDLEFIWSIDKARAWQFLRNLLSTFVNWPGLGIIYPTSWWAVVSVCHASTRDRNLRPITSPVAARLNRGNEKNKKNKIKKEKGKKESQIHWIFEINNFFSSPQ